MKRLQEILDQHAWDDRVCQKPWNQFLQSWAWGEFQKKCGRTVRRLAFCHPDGGYNLFAQWIEYQRYGFSYVFSPRGPFFVAEDQADHKKWEEMEDMLRSLRDEFALPRRTVFLRVEPIALASEISSIERFAIRRPSLNPSTTFLLDLHMSEEELLARMHQKTRYNIRLAERHRVRVRLARTTQDQEVFFRLLQETAERDGFLSQPESYLRRLMKALGPSGMARIRLAESEGVVHAANIEIFFGDTMTYLHGASSSAHRHVMAPYLLQWEAIRAAKKDGCHWYDFWGNNPDKKDAYDYKKTWEGMTRFKSGFGGVERCLVGTWDLPLRPFLYRLGRARW